MEILHPAVCSAKRDHRLEFFGHDGLAGEGAKRVGVVERPAPTARRMG